MGNFRANVFMNHFEYIASSHTQFPKLWFRYVDDIFGIVDNTLDVHNFLNYINNIYPSVKFTYENEVDKKIHFLDLIISRNNNQLEFVIYRKQTQTQNFIKNDLSSPYDHKHAVFHLLIHQLLHVPLSEINYNKELKLINIAETNGYNKQCIHKMLNKHKYNKLHKDNTLSNNNIKENLE